MLANLYTSLHYLYYTSLFRMVFLGLLTEEGGGEAKGPLPKKSFTCILTMISKAINLPKEDPIYKSCNTTHEFW